MINFIKNYTLNDLKQDFKYLILPFCFIITFYFLYITTYEILKGV